MVLEDILRVVKTIVVVCVKLENRTCSSCYQSILAETDFI